MTDTSSIVADATQRIFRELGDPQILGRADAHDARASLWNALEEAGLTRAWVDPDVGGSGASIGDGFAILRVAGEFAVSVPLAETLLASWLLALARVAPGGILTVAPARSVDRLLLDRAGSVSGTLFAVPFGREAEFIAFTCERDGETFIGTLARQQYEVVPSVNTAGDACDRIVVTHVKPATLAAAPAGFRVEDLQTMGAAVKAMQMSGALQSILDRSVSYANERVAFERPIGRFQVIQHNLARLAGEVAAAMAASDSAADAIASAPTFDDDVLLEVASAKIRCGEAVAVGAGIAHQVHGAIGYSREHVLHRYTQRLWSWRDDFGGESEWALALGRRVAQRGADRLWPWLASR